MYRIDLPVLNNANSLKIGGGKEDRTPDLCNAIAALSQLSYTPTGSLLLYTFFHQNQAKNAYRPKKIRQTICIGPTSSQFIQGLQ